MAETQMDEATLKNLVGQKITGSLGFMGGMLSQERLLAEQYYKGEAPGDAPVGRSQVISRDVAEAVDSTLPALLKIFASGDSIVRFDPRQPQDADMAKQATEYVNWFWFVRNPGFTILHNWFKDALLKKLGVVKIFWEEVASTERETYQGLTDKEFEAISQDDDVEIVSVSERQALITNPAIGVMPGAPMPQELVQPVYDVVARRNKTKGMARIVNVPPEEFLIDHRAVTLEEAPFLCHRRKATLTELKEMGFDPEVVDTLGPDGATDFNMERIERFRDEDAYPYRDDNYVDPSMREVWVNECYIKIDYDGDGYAELRQVMLAGESVYTLLSNEEVDDHPFATLTPVPMPHKVYGMSLADQVIDVQNIKTAVIRGAMDSMYFNIAPMVGLVEGQVNLDDLLNRRPGGVVRMKSPQGLIPLQTQQIQPDVFPMIEYWDSVREARTGVKRFQSTLDPDQINPLAQTATAAQIADNAADDRLQLIARIFAETGIKQACMRILELVCKHQDEKDTIRLRGKFVDIDPREWSTEMDIMVSIGLGTGNKDRQLQRLMALAPINEQIVQLQQGLNGPLITGENLYNWLGKVCEAADLPSPELYYSDPAQQPPQPPKPDPKMMQAQAQMQALQAKTQADIQGQNMRAQVDMALDKQKMQQQAALDAFHAHLDMQIETMKAQHEMQLERMRLEHQTRMDQQMTSAKVQATQVPAIAKGINLIPEETPQPKPRTTSLSSRQS